MGCHASSFVNKPVLQRMDTKTMLALQQQYRSTPTQIRQDDDIDFLSCAPLSPYSIREVFPAESRPVSPVSFTSGFFEDPLFLAGDESLNLGAHVAEAGDDVVWLRPHEIYPLPKLFVDGVSRCDVKQGLLGDCWLLSACAAVATRQDLLERVVDPSQPLHGSSYTGLLSFKFWRFGEWVEICIDDRLPTRNKKLIFASCTHPQEFWLPLLEKAFAKIYGSFGALEGGHSGSALADLTGGIAERIPTKKCTFKQLEEIFFHGAFVTCAGSESFTDSRGLVEGHAYTVTAVRGVDLTAGGTEHLVRLRSPWADDVEWRGPWSDRSCEWDGIKDNTTCRVACDDGEFWMSFTDFKERFQELTVATLGPDFDQDGAADVHRQSELIRGNWGAQSGGGSRNDLEKFQNNPQYLITLKDPQESGPSSVLIGLMQLPADFAKLHPIALFIYKTENGMERLGAEDFLCTSDFANSGPFTDTWEVIIRCFLPPGNYIVIPATFLPGCAANFLLRVYAVAPFDTQYLNPNSQS